jgi:hypothetical protein
MSKSLGPILPNFLPIDRHQTLMRFFFTAFLLTLSQLGLGQVLMLSGSVVSGKSKVPLPFVNIGVLGTTRGTTTDLDGRFQINVNSTDTLLFSYVGFWKLRMIANQLPGGSPVIELQEKTTDLKDVVIKAGENPAWKIMRKLIANREKNDPEHLSTFTYNCYNKLYGTMIDPNIDPGLPNMDTSKARKFFDKSHLFIFESYTKRYYKKPNQTKEIILGNQMTGVKDPFFSMTATDVQSFSFYTDYIKLFDKVYINPASKGFEDRYDLVLEDTVYQDRDSIYVISFEPFEGKNFNGLKGQFQISTDGYAFKNILVEPADIFSLISGKIHHIYEKVGNTWFPSQLNTDLFFRQFGIAQLKLRYISRSYITNVEVNPEIDNKIFGTLNVEFDDKANFQTDQFWDASRTDTLSRKDKKTFQVYDSLGAKLNTFNTIFKFVEALATGKIKAGPMYLPLPDIIKFNNYESVRVGMGLQTGSAISKIFSLNGYAGYGLSDKAWKYGAGAQIKLPTRRETWMRMDWSRDIAEPGASQLLKSPVLGNETFRNWAVSRMDSVTSYKLEMGLRPIPFSEVRLTLKQETRNPTYRYHYSREAGSADSSYSISEGSIALRYAVGERFTQIRDSKIVTGLEYPQLFLSFTKSFSGVLDGEYNYTKWEVKIDHRFQWRGFGKTIICLQGGIAMGKIPYPYLFNGKGTRFEGSVNNSVVINNYFQTMGLYEFTSDRYAYLFFNHNFGRIVSDKNKHFRPELTLLHNVGYGSLRNQSQHVGLDFKTMERGFYESGLLLYNILRFKYAKLVYIGIGGGVFYRYGANALPMESENYAYKLALSLSF